MPVRTLNSSSLKAQLTGLSAHYRDVESPVLAFNGAAWDGPPTLEADSRTWHVKVCRSELEFREALAMRTDDGASLVLLTELSQTDLGSDVVARLVKQRVFQVDAWEPVLRAFGAQRIDGRLTRLAWMPDVLLEGTPAAGYPQVASGTLDATTAWRWVVRGLLGVDVEEPDVRALVEWTLDPAVLRRWGALSPDRVTDLAAWLLGTIGPGAELPLALLKNGHGADVVPIGVVCGALFAGGGEPSGVRGAAAIRLERWTGGLPVSASRGLSLASVAGEVLGALKAAADSRVPVLLARADDLLQELGAEAEAWGSRWLPRGFQQRLDRYAGALTRALRDDDAAAAIAHAVEQLQSLREHAGALDDPDRIARAGQALRLVRYLRTGDNRAPESFPQAVADYASNHAFADVARYALYSSEAHQGFGAAMSAVADAAAASRDEVTSAFARLAAGWFEAPSDAEGLVPIEKVLTTAVAPLAAQGPVLLLVVDGMNAVAAESLSASIARRGWVQVGPSGAPGRAAVIPVLPSVTEVCRTSLLCGKLMKGTQSTERDGFGAHPALVAISKPAFPPVVFHKASLGAAAELEPDVAAAIANPDQRIVSAVVNAVDDHLLKDDMVRPTWTTEYVPVIGALCDAARAAGRRLVVTADHGHVLDLKLTSKIPGDGADRYRRSSDAARDGEVLVSGERVLADGGRVVVAASERIRYSARKNGYHGGISPQEMVVPLLHFAPEGHVPDGYREVTPLRPAWWDLEARLGPAEEVAPVPATRRTGLPLFDVAPEVGGPVRPVGEPWWLVHLLASEVLKNQRARVVRAAVTDERLKTLLVTLASRGGRMTVAAVADRMGMPPGRVTSTVAAAAQLLNFDGYQVLFTEGDEVVVNEMLLVTQFEIQRES